MFDLNYSILNWKQNLLGNESFTRENIDELESHLTEQINDLTGAGLNDEEAFWVAQKRIGTIETLNDEFTKINTLDILRKKVYWMLTGVAGMLMYVFIVTSAYYVIISLFMVMNFDPVSFILINNSINEIIVLLVCSLIIWVMTTKNARFADKYLYGKMDWLKKSKIKIFAILTFVISGVIYFYYTYKLSTDVNRWIVNSGSYGEFKEMNKFLNPLQFVFNSALILIMYYVSFKNRKRPDIISG